MKSLTRAEEQVMQVLWSLKKSFLKEIVENSPEPRPHPNTVSTILKILIEKGFVDFETQGRNNLYHPKISREEYGKKSAQQVVKGYFNGSPALLVSQFLSDNKLSVEELEEMLEKIKSAKQKA